MFDRGDSSLECLIEEPPPLKVGKGSRLLSPLSNIQGCCLLYQPFKAAVSSIKHPNCCLLYQAFNAAVSSIKRGDSSPECLIEETTALNL
jgi:hypothetical protein